MPSKSDKYICAAIAFALNIIAIVFENEIFLLAGCMFWCTSMIIERLDK